MFYNLISKAICSDCTDISLQIFVYNCVFRKKEKQHSRNLSHFEQEPEVYELEIMQPPTRDDWITDIREAVDAASPGSDSDPDEDYTKSLRKSVDDKYLRLRRLTAELRGKDIELSKVLESKMKIMYEILDIVQGINIYLLCYLRSRGLLYFTTQ